MLFRSFDSKKKKAILSGDYLDDIREHFSVKNEASKFSRGRFIPSRTYAITSTGRFDPPLFSEILKFIENKSDIEILAIGIGHDVSRYYQKAIKITDVQELGDVMIGQLSGLLENKKKLH